jgi:haloacetate dehalogenase
MAQPPGPPEALVGGAPETFYGYFPAAWTQVPDAIPADIRAEYRANAILDVEHDTTDREAGDRLGMPVTVLQQDWGATLGYDALGLRQAWATDLHHHTVKAGNSWPRSRPPRS